MANSSDFFYSPVCINSSALGTSAAAEVWSWGLIVLKPRCFTCLHQNNQSLLLYIRNSAERQKMAGLTVSVV
jgi:hypothetical protein